MGQRQQQGAEAEQRDRTCALQDEAACRGLADAHDFRSPGRLTAFQEIDDSVDFLLGQNAVTPEWRHHGLRISPGLVADDGDQVVTVGVFGFDVRESRPDRARQVAALDHMTGQAIALAAIEGELLAVGGGGLCASGGALVMPTISASAAGRRVFLEYWVKVASPDWSISPTGVERPCRSRSETLPPCWR